MKKVLIGFFSLIIPGLTAFFIFAPGIAVQRMNPITPQQPHKVSAKAQALHQRLTIIDWHADSLLWKRNLLQRDNKGHVDFPRLREGNVAVQMFTTVTKTPAGRNYFANRTDAQDQITLLAMGQLWPLRTWDDLTERALYQAEKLQHMADTAPESVSVIRNRDDLKAVLAQRKQGSNITGALIGAEGGHALSGKLENLDRLEAAGFRMIGLTHFFDNKLGGSLHGISNQGLTAFGRDVVKAMEQKKIIVDLSHTSQKMVQDVLAIAKRPVVVSHTGIYSQCKTRRNLPDRLMKQIAAKGGLIAVGYWANVTCNDSATGVAKTIAAAVKLLGEDHVALGSDYDGAVGVGFDTSELSGLTQALLDTGLSERVIGKVMGGNSVRFLMENLP
ncbi:MAG: dipeptidase [Thiolinea sp.]